MSNDTDPPTDAAPPWVLHVDPPTPPDPFSPRPARTWARWPGAPWTRILNAEVTDDAAVLQLPDGADDLVLIPPPRPLLLTSHPDQPADDYRTPAGMEGRTPTGERCWLTDEQARAVRMILGQEYADADVIGPFFHWGRGAGKSTVMATVRWIISQPENTAAAVDLSPARAARWLRETADPTDPAGYRLMDPPADVDEHRLTTVLSTMLSIAGIDGKPVVTRQVGDATRLDVSIGRYPNVRRFVITVHPAGAGTDPRDLVTQLARGLLDIAEQAMSDGYLATDARCRLARAALAAPPAGPPPAAVYPDAWRAHVADLPAWLTEAVVDQVGDPEVATRFATLGYLAGLVRAANETGVV